LAGGGAPKTTLISTEVGLLLQVNNKGRWYYLPCTFRAASRRENTRLALPS